MSDDFTQCWHAPGPTCKEDDLPIRVWCRFCLREDRRELEDALRDVLYEWERCAAIYERACKRVEDIKARLLPDEEDDRGE